MVNHTALTDSEASEAGTGGNRAETVRAVLVFVSWPALGASLRAPDRLSTSGGRPLLPLALLPTLPRAPAHLGARRSALSANSNTNPKFLNRQGAKNDKTDAI